MLQETRCLLSSQSTNPASRNQRLRNGGGNLKLTLFLKACIFEWYWRTPYTTVNCTIVFSYTLPFKQGVLHKGVEKIFRWEHQIKHKPKFR